MAGQWQEGTPPAMKDPGPAGARSQIPNTSPSSAPAPKVLASTAGAGLGGAGGAVVVWALQSAGVDVSPEIGIAISTFISIIASFVAGYMTPPKGS